MKVGKLFDFKFQGFHCSVEYTGFKINESD